MISIVLGLITSLNAVGVSGTVAQCNEIVKHLVRVSVYDNMHVDENSIHFDEDLDIIKKFKNNCIKRGSK